MEGLWQASKVLLNSSKQGQFTIKKCFFLQWRPFKEVLKSIPNVYLKHIKNTKSNQFFGGGLGWLTATFML